MLLRGDRQAPWAETYFRGRQTPTPAGKPLAEVSAGKETGGTCGECSAHQGELRLPAPLLPPAAGSRRERATSGMHTCALEVRAPSRPFAVWALWCATRLRGTSSCAGRRPCAEALDAPTVSAWARGRGGRAAAEEPLQGEVGQAADRGQEEDLPLAAGARPRSHRRVAEALPGRGQTLFRLWPTSGRGVRFRRRGHRLQGRLDLRQPPDAARRHPARLRPAHGQQDPVSTPARVRLRAPGRGGGHQGPLRVPRSLGPGLHTTDVRAPAAVQRDPHPRGDRRRLHGSRGEGRRRAARRPGQKPRLRATPGNTADAPPHATDARSPATRAAAGTR